MPQEELDVTSPPDETIDPQWLEHMRWVYDVSRQRMDRVDQWVGAILAIGAVVVAYASSSLGGSPSPSQWVFLAAMAASLIGVAETLRSARPSKFVTFNTAVYREYWDQTKAGTFGAPIEHSFVQELVGSGGAEGVIAAIDSQTQERMNGVRRGLGLLGASLVLLFAAALLQTIIPT